MKPAKSNPVADEPIVIDRIFNAPAARVWQAITDIALMRQWYFSNLQAFKAEVGFETSFNVHHNGKDFPHVWKVTEVVPGKRLTYSWKYQGHPGESFVTFVLFADGNKTRLVLTHSGLETFQPEKYPDMASSNFIQGWTKIIGTSLKEFLEKENSMPTSNIRHAGEENPVFIISRTFDAPRDLVWKAWTTPELMVRWYGPKGFTASYKKFDFRPGGTYHYCLKSPDGLEMWGKLTYHDIAAPEKLVFTTAFSDAEGNLSRHPMSPTWPSEMMTTIAFAEKAGKTTVTVEWIPVNPTAEERNTFIEGMSGMEQGWGGTFEQLEAFLKTQTK